jgi:FkbM family methyltransferase
VTGIRKSIGISEGPIWWVIFHTFAAIVTEMIMEINKQHVNINVVDAGARYGLHPTWSPFKEIADIYMFEIDAMEVKRLSDKYRDFSNIHIFHRGLYDQPGYVDYHQFAHKGLTNMLTVDQDNIYRHRFMVEDYKHVDEDVVETVTLDRFFDEKDIHFIKLDTEGIELKILKGAYK